MAQRPTRSLKHEYELFVEQEIEAYKESIPRSVLLSIGDDAVATLATEAQLALTELLLCEEVDRLIFNRLRLPSYSTWRRRRIRLADEMRRPEHWGLRPDDVLVRALVPMSDASVLVAGAAEETSALYLAANGCDVTTIANEADVLERVMRAAVGAGLAGRIHGCLGDLSSWAPDVPLAAVIVNPASLEGLPANERARIIELLQSATRDGGVHLVRALAGSHGTSDRPPDSLSFDELRSRYTGWSVSVEPSDAANVFLARKDGSIATA